MNALTEQLERLANRGPAAEPRDVVAAAVARATDVPRPMRPRHGYVRPLVVGLAAAVIGGVGLAALNAREPQSPASGESSVLGSNETQPTLDATEVEPVETLPDFDDLSDTPVTVAGTAPTDWYRLQPDLDVAWYSRNTVSSLCFRTPRGMSCQPDRFRPIEFGGEPIVVGTGGDQVLVVTLDERDDITVELSDGTFLSAAVERDDQISWGVARLELPDGVSVESSALFLMVGPTTGTTTASSTG